MIDTYIKKEDGKYVIYEKDKLGYVCHGYYDSYSLAKKRFKTIQSLNKLIDSINSLAGNEEPSCN